VINNLVKQHLHCAATRMKFQAGKGRIEREFEVGEWVFLKLLPYVQTSLAPRSSQKLAFNFFGPYKIVQKVGSVAYRLELTESSLVHPVFHVSQLKKAVGSKYLVSSLPLDIQSLQVTEKVLQKRLVARDACTIMQILVKWSVLLESLAT
jgi:hypothetical protein